MVGISPRQLLSTLLVVAASTQLTAAECAPFSGNFTISQYQLYPENADWDSQRCVLYLGYALERRTLDYRPR